MKRFLIERDVPGITGMSHTELCGVARSANQAIAELIPKIQWEQSYIIDDKIFCVYLADSEESINKHAEIAGFPITKISKVTQIIDPMTAEKHF